MSGDTELIREMNGAIGAGDMRAFAARVHPEVVWEHNLGAGSPEEGTYRGRESVVALLERILEPWEYMRPEPREIRDVGGGRYLVRGDLHSKHSTSATEVVTPYVQQVEIRAGMLAKGRITTGTDRLPESDKIASLRRFLAAFNSRDIDSVAGELDPDVELHEWPEAPGSQSYRGPDGVRRAIDSWFETWEWMRVEVEDIVEVGDHVLFTLHQRAKGKGSEAEVEVRSFNVYTFRDGKVTRIQLFIERDRALAAAGLTPDYEEEKR
jgi:ketosteroid isomerase-like protein